MGIADAGGERTTFSAWMHQLARFSDVQPEGEPPLVGGDRVADRYEVRRLLGRGGMGFVYEAFDEAAELPCALKTVRALSPERILLLKNEFRAIARVLHANLVRPGELLEDHGRWFFTMELVQGQDPLVWADGGEDRVRHVVGGIADVLAVMHANGVMHRDIKPSNVLVDSSHRVVLLDLGLARDHLRPLWFDSAIAGTTLYMAPEQHAREVAIGPPADMYALGVLLYELAVGKPPDQAAPRISAIRRDVSAEVDDVCSALLAVDPIARPDAASLARRWCARPTATVTTRSPLLVGRDSELARLDLAHDRSARAIFVHGPAGIGKSALVDHWLQQRAARGALVLRGRCYERERMPYKALDGVIDALATTLAELPQVAALAPASLLRVFPALAALFPNDATNSPNNEAGDRRDELASGLRSVLERLADQSPIIVFVDDLQWGDRDGIALLVHALEDTSAAICLVATTRENAPPELLARLAGATSITLAPLATDAARRLALSLVTNPASSVDELLARANGHPFLIEDACHARTLEHRADALSAGLRDVLDLVIVAGAPLSFRTLALAARTATSELASMIHVLEAERLVRAGTQTIEPSHDRVREQLYERLSPDARRSHHERLAKAIEQVSPDASSQLATHFAAAKLDEPAFRYACIAAETAMLAHAYAHAAELYEVAIATASSEVQEVRVKRARALVLAWRPLDAAHAFLEAANATEGGAMRGLRRQAVEQALVGGDLELGLAELDRVLRASGMRPPRRAWSAMVTALIRRVVLAVRGFEPSSSEHSDPELIDVLWSASLALAMIDSLLALGYHSKALLLALDANDPGRLVRCLSIESCIQAGSASLYEARRLIATATATAPRTEDAENALRAARIVLAVQEGRWLEALEEGRADVAGLTPWHAAARELYMSHAELNLGRFADLSARCERLHREAGDRGDQFLELAMGASFTPLMYLAHDDVMAARRTIVRAENLLWRGGRGGYFHALAAIATLFADLYEGNYAGALAGWRGPGNEMLGKRSHYGRVYLELLGANAALAMLRTNRRDRTARGRVVSAHRALCRSRLPWAAPYADLVAAQLALLDRSEAAPLLERARAGFVRFGADHLIDIVDRDSAKLRLRGIVQSERFAAMFAPVLAE
jgi:hypothetical protein